MDNEQSGKTPPQAGSESAWDGDAEKEHWKSQYENIKSELESLTPDSDVLGELGNLEAAEAHGGDAERREEPRYHFKNQENRNVNIYAHIGPKAFEIVNISVGGLAFYSDTSFENGTNLLLSALGMVALDVDVVSCEMEETDSDFMEYRYLVRAKFSERVNGYLVYVLSREMYLRQLQGDDDKKDR